MWSGDSFHQEHRSYNVFRNTPALAFPSNPFNSLAGAPGPNAHFGSLFSLFFDP